MLPNVVEEVVMVDSETWATRAFATGVEKDGEGSAEATQKEEMPLKEGQPVLCKAWPCDGKYGVVVDPWDTSPTPVRHPKKTVLVQVQGESYCLHFAPDELVKASESADVDIAIGDKVYVVAGPHASHFVDKRSEVMKLRQGVAYIQHPPPSPEGTEADAVITTAYVKVEHLRKRLVQQVHARLEQAKDMMTCRKQSTGDVQKALGEWLSTQEGRTALAEKKCTTWKLCEALGVEGSREECEQVRVAMVRLGYRSEWVLGVPESARYKAWVIGQIAQPYPEETEQVMDTVEERIAPWLTSVPGAAVVHAGRCTTVCICEALGLDLEFATQARVARVMRKLGYKREHRTVGGIGLFVWLPSDEEQVTQRAETERLSKPSKTGEKQEERPLYSLPLLTNLHVLMAWVFGFLKSDPLMALLDALHKCGALPEYNEINVYAVTFKTGARAICAFALECERLGIKSPEDLTVYLMQAKCNASDAEFAAYQMAMRYQLYANECRRRGETPSIISRDALNGWLMMLSDVADDIRSVCERQQNQGSEWISDEEADLDALIYIVNAFGGRPIGEAATQARRRRMNKVATSETERPTGA